MSTGRQPFSRRVLLPLLVIISTVSVLAVGGYELLSVKLRTDNQTSTQMPVDPGNEQPDQLPVNVFNATKVSGLARERADYLTSRNWIIKQIGNWSGEKVTRSTIYYPKGRRASAIALSAVVVAQVLPAPDQLESDSLTYIIKS